MEPLRATPVMLADIPFFHGLGGEALEEAAALFQVENHRRGSLLAGRGLQGLERWQSRVNFVCRGAVALYTLTKNSSRKILFFQGPGRLLSHSVMGSRPCALYGEVVENAILLSAPREDFARLVSASPPLTRALLEHYETSLWRMSHQLKNTAGYLPVERKLAIKLLKLAQDFGRERAGETAIELTLTVTQLADFVGVPRETASRAVGRLGRLGLVRYENRRFTLPDREACAAYCREGE